ncbi:MAG TPA: hypothetical protein VLD37_01690 [Candidatus Bilamarchaeum sp.]|nr:hypothetical protein [Candidatus Bilamarchaeum sp.]
MARLMAPRITGTNTTTYKAVTISLDGDQFDRIRLTEKVVLKAYGPQGSGSMELVLRNAGRGKRNARGSETLAIEADEDTFIGLISPTMKVRFLGDSSRTTFETERITCMPLFAAKAPLLEQSLKD